MNEHYKWHYHSVKCNQCNKSFARTWDLRIHLKTKHSINNEDSFEKCKFCDKRFATLKSLRNHIKLVHEKCNKSFLCRKCHKKFNRKSSLKNHWMTHKVEETKNHFQCKLCDISFTFKYNLNKHNRKFHQNKK